MILIAAKSQSENGLFNSGQQHRLKVGFDPSCFRGGNVTFVGFAMWRVPELGNTILADEQVFVVRSGNVTPLSPRTEFADHSPDGLSWGYIGSATAQLALAMLMEVFEDWPRVERIYEDFRDSFVARLPRNNNWIATGYEIAAFARSIEKKLPRKP